MKTPMTAKLSVRLDRDTTATLAAVSALLAEVPQREHTPRRYLGPQGPDWRPGRGPYRPSCWGHYGPSWPDETMYTEEWYAEREGTAARRRETYRKRRDARRAAETEELAP